MSTSSPWKMARGTISFPDTRIMEGRATSTEVTPATEIGASFPKYLQMKGAPTSATSSRMTFVRSAIVASSVANYAPRSGVLSSIIKIDESE